MIPRVVQQITYWPIYLVLKFLFRYRVEGQENLEGLGDKPIIFVSNHASLLDGPVCAAAMPRDLVAPVKFSPIRFLVIKEHFSWKNSFPFPISLFTAFYVRVNGSIPVIHGLGDFQRNLAGAIRALRKGSKIWIYPEGKITRDGKLQLGKKGAAYLHQATGASIVPVGLNGTFQILKSKKIKIKIGKPIHSLGNLSLEESTEKIMREISKLID